jgi:fumarate hydratase class I
VRVIRLPRHGASCPVAIAVSCSADRQAHSQITADGVYLEQLETDPAQYLPETTPMTHRRRGADRPAAPMKRDPGRAHRAPGGGPALMTGPLVVARDIARPKIAERLPPVSPCRNT